MAFSSNRDGGEGGGGRGPRRSNKFVRFGMRGRKKVEPEEPLDYKNVNYLMRFVSPQGKIMSRKRTGFSGQHQRRLANAIKVARFMSLLPYIGRL